MKGYCMNDGTTKRLKKNSALLPSAIKKGWFARAQRGRTRRNQEAGTLLVVAAFFLKSPKRGRATIQ